MSDSPVTAVLFTTEVERLAEFYAAVAGLRRLHADAEHVALERDGFRLFVHAIPAAQARGIVVSAPPTVRERAALKLSFAVPSLAGARAAAVGRGGAIYGVEREWRSATELHCDGHDPDGNVLQLRERLPKSPRRSWLPARAAPLVLPLVLSFLMTCVVSFISTARSVGFPPEFPRLWLGAWALSWIIAFPLLLVVLPLARAATDWVLGRP